MRKNLHDILRTAKIDLQREYARLFQQFYKEPLEIVFDKQFLTLKRFDSIAQLIEVCFTSLDKKLTGRCISLKDFNNTHDFNFLRDPANVDIDFLVLFAEYILTFCRGLITIKVVSEKEVQRLMENVISFMDDIGYTSIEKDNIIIFVEKAPAAIAAAEIVEPELSYPILEYNHHRLKGQLTRKRAILKQMADNIEPKRNELNSINKSFSSNLFQLLNKFIRHDTSGNEQITDMTNNELELVYDDIYQMWLLAVLQLDNVERSKRIEDLIKLINQ